MAAPRSFRLCLCIFLAVFIVLFFFDSPFSTSLGSGPQLDGVRLDDAPSHEVDGVSLPLTVDVMSQSVLDDKNQLVFQEESRSRDGQLDELRRFEPHNYKGAGHKTFATYLNTENASMDEPHFVAAQLLAHRLLWDPDTKSSYPLTVFVAPFVAHEQRDYLAAIGAVVREVDLVPWYSSAPINLWNETEYSRIAFLDIESYPLINVDALLENLSHRQVCPRSRLQPEDRNTFDELCEYMFAATRQSQGDTELDGRVFVLEPNLAMYARLERESQSTDIVGHGSGELVSLSHAFRPDGPFPVEFIKGQEWDAASWDPEQRKELKLVHQESMLIEEAHVHGLRDFYESVAFWQLRAADGLLSAV